MPLLAQEIVSAPKDRKLTHEKCLKPDHGHKRSFETHDQDIVFFISHNSRTSLKFNFFITLVIKNLIYLFSFHLIHDHSFPT